MQVIYVIDLAKQSMKEMFCFYWFHHVMGIEVIQPTFF